MYGDNPRNAVKPAVIVSSSPDATNCGQTVSMCRAANTEETFVGSAQNASVLELFVTRGPHGAAMRTQCGWVWVTRRAS